MHVAQNYYYSCKELGFYVTVFVLWAKKVIIILRFCVLIVYLRRMEAVACHKLNCRRNSAHQREAGKVYFAENSFTVLIECKREKDFSESKHNCLYVLTILLG